MWHPPDEDKLRFALSCGEGPYLQYVSDTVYIEFKIKLKDYLNHFLSIISHFLYPNIAENFLELV